MKLFKKKDTSGSRRSAKLLALRMKRYGMMGLAATVLAVSTYYGYTHHTGDKVETWVSEKTSAALTSAGFKVTDILVTGRSHISQQEILAHVSMKYGDPIFKVSIADMQKSLEEISWVKTASVSRRLPGTIVVSINERMPVALWQYQKKISVIDDEGKVLTQDDTDSYKNLPMIVGEDAGAHAVDLVALMQAEPEVARQVASAVRVGSRRWDLHMKNGLLVKLPEENEELALRKFAASEEAHKLLEKDVVAVDLRIPDKFVIETQVAAAVDKKDKKKT